jgi:hypothetical protein
MPLAPPVTTQTLPSGRMFLVFLSFSSPRSADQLKL